MQQPLLETIIQLISQHAAAHLPETPQSAAVMLILLTSENSSSLEIVLTKRSSTLPTYTGQVSFPGGMHDLEDVDLYATALREVREELNLQPTSYHLIGALDDFQDRDGNLVRPFVSYMLKSDFLNHLKISIDEIERVYYLPVEKIADFHDDPKLHGVTRRSPSYSFTDQDIFVWGLTASVLVDFYNIITGVKRPLGRRTRM